MAIWLHPGSLANKLRKLVQAPEFSRYMLRFRLKCYEKDVCGWRFG